MRLIYSLLIVVVIFSCQERKPIPAPFQTFEFFYTDTWNTAFAVKFGQTDTIWVKQEFVSKRHSNTDTLLQSNTAYYGLLNPGQKDSLYEAIRQMPFDQYDSVYAEVTVHDGRMMNFHVVTDSTIKNVLVTEENGPAELWDFSKRIIEIKKQINWKKLDSMPTFYWREPELIIDTSKFRPPA